MSRSRKKTPIGGVTTARSEKGDKKRWHKGYRTRVKIALAIDIDGDLPHIREFFNPRGMQKDGKHWFSDIEEKFFRK